MHIRIPTFCRTNSLLGDAIEGGLIVETEIARVDNVVGICLLREVVEGTQVAYRLSVSKVAAGFAGQLSLPRTSAIQRTRIGPC